MDAHRLGELRSIAYHREVAARLARAPELVLRARSRVEAWQAAGEVHPFYVEAWLELLRGPVEALSAFLVEDSERARSLRQVTPFAGVVTPRERWQIWRDVKAASR